MSWAHGLTGWYGSCIRRKGFGSEIFIEPPTAGSTAYSYWLTDILLRIWDSLIEYPSASYGHYDEHRNRNGDLWRPGKRSGKALTPPFLRHLSIESTSKQMQVICNGFGICSGNRGALIRSHAKCSYSQPLCGCCSGRYPPSPRITRSLLNGA